MEDMENYGYTLFRTIPISMTAKSIIIFICFIFLFLGIRIRYKGSSLILWQIYARHFPTLQ